MLVYSDIAKESSQIGELKVRRPNLPSGIRNVIAKESSQIGELKVIMGVGKPY